MSIFRINSLLYYLQFFAVAAVNILCSPLLLASLGDTLFGAWKVVNRFLDLATIFDGRPGATLKISLSSEIGRNSDEERLRQMIGAAFYLMRKALFLFVPIVLLVAFFSPYFVVGLSRNNHDDVVIFSLILVVAILFSTIYSVYDAALFSEMKSYVSSLIQIFSSVILGFGFFVSSKEGWALLGVGFASLFSAMAAFFLYKFSAKKFIRWYGVSSPSKEMTIKFGSSSKWSAFWAVVEKIVLSIDVFLIGFYCGAPEVAGYTFGTYIYQLALTIALVGTSAYIPALMKKYSSGNISEAKIIFFMIKRKLLFVLVGFSIFIALFNDYIVKIWVGKNVFIEDGLSIFLAIMLVQLSYLRCLGQVMDAINMINVKTIHFLFGILFSALLVFFLHAMHENIKVSEIIFCIIFGRLPAVFLFRDRVNKAFISA